MQDWQNGGFGIYLHWPFCEAKCPYCDFNSFVSASVDHDAWRRAFLAELDRYAAQTQGRVVNSVFFGGGTPSLMPAGMVGDIVDKISQNWRVANDIEITLEANPSSVEAAKFADFRAAGVNRVSLGVQALNDDALKRLGRLHDVSQALAALDIAANTFDRFSFDLIYARQHQALAEWQGELAQALSFGAKHVSMYQLTIEPETAFGQRARLGKLPGLPDQDVAADMYEHTQAACAAAGLPAYEISNHAAVGDESRHNMIYWSGGDFLGIGPGAHGRVTVGPVRYATETWLAPNKWLAAAMAGNGETSRAALTPVEQADEYMMMGLRKTSGIDMARWVALGDGTPVMVDPDLIENGVVRVADNRLIATDRGRDKRSRVTCG